VPFYTWLYFELLLIRPKTTLVSRSRRPPRIDVGAGIMRRSSVCMKALSGI